MNKIFAISGREIRSHYLSPLGYVVLGTFLGFSGLFFYVSLSRFSDLCLQFGNNPYYLRQLNVNDMVVGPMFGSMRFIFLLMIPIVTMRLLAEEKKSGTMELLLTSPLSPRDLVWGKFLGGVGLIFLLLVPVQLFPFILIWIGEPDVPPMFIGFSGLLVMGATFVAIGLFFSSLTENQIIAALTSFGTILFFWIVPFLGAKVGAFFSQMISSLVGPREWIGGLESAISNGISYLSLLEHMENFEKGVIDSTDIIFYFSVIAFFIFLTLRVVESNRWR